MPTNIIQGFSKLSRNEKVDALVNQQQLGHDFSSRLNRYLHPSEQQLFNEISENTLTNFYLPWGVAPNFLIDGEIFHLPMVIEESSVVAAASKAARFWAAHGGFKTRILGTTKIGQIHFEYQGNETLLQKHLPSIAEQLTATTRNLTANMAQRGGGITHFEIIKTGDASRHLYQLQVHFETADSMGANFINSCLEAMRQPFETILKSLEPDMDDANVVMCILSNFTPQCVVECTVSCDIQELAQLSGIYSPEAFASRFEQAIYIATLDPYRATTHNKGIFNGIDAVVLATGNDFRAIEANGHAFAAKDGKYRSLTAINLNDNTFTYTLTIPLTLGTVGGLTTLHPMAKASMELLGHPSATQLMKIVAAAGLANNFMAVTSLITHGIQKGHMKLHLNNILRTLEASEYQTEAAQQYFSDKTVSYSAVKLFLAQTKR